MTDTPSTWDLAKCPGCAYPLEGLGHAPCPECGLTPDEFQELVKRHRSRVPAGFTFRTCGAVWGIAAVLLLMNAMVSNGGLFVFGFMILAGALCAVSFVLDSTNPVSPVTVRQANPHAFIIAVQQIILFALLCSGTFIVLFGLIELFMAI